MTKKILILFAVFISAAYGQFNDDNNRFMLGQSYAQSGDFKKAKEIFGGLYNSSPNNPQYFQSLNDVLLQLKEYDASVNLIQQRIAATPQDINLYGLLGSTYYLKKDEAKAFQVWDDALQKLAPNKTGDSRSQVYYRVIANYAIERRAFEKAIDIMKKGKSLGDSEDLFSFDLANLYTITMRFKEAAEEYCSILSKNPNQLNAVEARIYSYINKPDALKETISILEDCRKEDNISFSYLLARLYKEEKNYDKAYSLYKEIDNKQGSQGTELFNFAQMIYNEGEYKVASEIYNDILNKYPNSPFVSNIKLGFAKTTEALIMNEDDSLSHMWKPYYKINVSPSEKVKKVISAYDDIIKMYPHSEIANEALLRTGRLVYYKEGNPEAAKEYFANIVNDGPLSRFAPDAYEELANIALMNGKLDESKSFLERINASVRADVEKRNLSKYKLANICFYTGDFNQAKQILNEILSDLKDNNANDAIELSLLLNTTMNDSSNLVIFAKAELLAEQKKFTEAEAEYKLIAQDSKGFMLNNLAKIRIAEMELALGNLETSLDLFSKIAGENEKNIYADKALYLQGQIYQFGLNNTAKAIEVYESLLAKFPNSLYLDDARDAIIKLRNKLS